jgi:hypothetical protein
MRELTTSRSSGRGVRTGICAGLLGLSVALPFGRAGAQRVAPTPGMVDTFRVEFAEIMAVRELSNGDILVSDGVERSLFLLDGRSLAGRRLVREGDGPGELRSPGKLLALPNDTTVVIDRRSRRWLYFHRSQYVRERNGASFEARNIGSFASGADARGRVLAVRGFSQQGTNSIARGMPPEYSAMSDSVAVILADLSRAHVDTVARGRGGYRGPSKRIARTVGESVVQYTMLPFYTTYDQAVILDDGTIALVRVEPYSVTWISSDARRTSVALPVTREPVNAAQREFAVQQRNASNTQRWKPDDYPHWPTEIPPFLENAVLPTKDGRVVVLRTPSVRDSMPRYDIVGPGHDQIATRRLGPGQRIVSFGRGTAYVAAREGDGVERLLRVPWR